MNEALQQALAGLLTKLTDTITTATTQVADQIPTLVTQMIGFQILKYWIWIGVEGAVLFGFPFLIYALIKDDAKNEKSDDNWAGLCFCLGIIWLGAGISIVMDVIQLVKLYNFPLVWILDYLKDLTAK